MTFENLTRYVAPHNCYIVFLSRFFIYRHISDDIDCALCAVVLFFLIVKERCHFSSLGGSLVLMRSLYYFFIYCQTIL